MYARLSLSKRGNVYMNNGDIQQTSLYRFKGQDLFNQIRKLLTDVQLTPYEEQHRIFFIERNIILPVKALMLLLLAYYLFFSRWFDETAAYRHAIVLGLQAFYVFYCILNVASGCILIGGKNLPFKWVRLAALVSSSTDTCLLCASTIITGGIDSPLFWVLLGMIVRNSVSFPSISYQFLLNLSILFSYITAALTECLISVWEIIDSGEPVIFTVRPHTFENISGILTMQVFLIILLIICCYGIQVILVKQRIAEEEAREFAVRKEQLKITGRLAAEIAHQLKNPLGIINNAAFNLQRNVKEGKATITQQIRIIREEVERSDRIITDLMGYAKLAEATIEKLNVVEEVNKAIEQVFPKGTFEVTVHKEFDALLPPLLMPRNHFLEILVNLLINAREAVQGKGNVFVSVKNIENQWIEISIADDGPGIPQEIHNKIFEPYFTTKPRGTGLGLAIVKKNTEIYGGTVRLESEPGKGTKFILKFSVKSLIKS